MEAFPHRYRVRGAGQIAGDIELTGDRLPTLPSASPVQFDGPGDRWSPETLLVGAVADCFLLTFRSIARASNLSWTSIDCDVVGTLDQIDRVTQFTHFDLRARLALPQGGDPSQSRRVLEKAERNCLIANSLKASVDLECSIDVAEPIEMAVASS